MVIPACSRSGRESSGPVAQLAVDARYAQRTSSLRFDRNAAGKAKALGHGTRSDSVLVYDFQNGALPVPAAMRRRAAWRRRNPAKSLESRSFINLEIALGGAFSVFCRMG